MISLVGKLEQKKPQRGRDPGARDETGFCSGLVTCPKQELKATQATPIKHTVRKPGRRDSRLLEGAWETTVRQGTCQAARALCPRWSLVTCGHLQLNLMVNQSQ